MRWILEIVAMIGVAALAKAFLINANSVVDDLLSTHHGADPDSGRD